MTKVLLAAALATLLATSSAYADDNSFKTSAEPIVLALYEAPARSLETPHGNSVRAPSNEVQETASRPVKNESTFFSRLAEKIIVGSASVLAKPAAGSAYAFAR